MLTWSKLCGPAPGGVRRTAYSRRGAWPGHAGLRLVRAGPGHHQGRRAALAERRGHQAAGGPPGGVELLPVDQEHDQRGVHPEVVGQPYKAPSGIVNQPRVDLTV